MNNIQYVVDELMVVVVMVVDLDGWLCKGDDCEEALCDEYGSCEHDLFLCVVHLFVCF